MLLTFSLEPLTHDEGTLAFPAGGEEPRAKAWKWGGMKREPAGTSEANWPVRTERMELFLEQHKASWAETPFLSVLAFDRILSRKPGYTYIVLQACTTDV